MGNRVDHLSFAEPHDFKIRSHSPAPEIQVLDIDGWKLSVLAKGALDTFVRQRASAG